MKSADELLADIESKDYLLYVAWTVIANAGGGNWENETDEWYEAAVRWRDGYHVQLVEVHT